MTQNTPNIITREEWGATPIPYNKPYFPQVPTCIIFHHYGMTTDNANFKFMPTFKGNKTIQKIQRNAINKEGLIDIQYHYIIAPSGDIYLGRPDCVMGKHCKSHDNGSIGILCFGNFNAEKLPFEMKSSIVWLMRFLKSKYHTLDMPSCILTHRDKNFTSCPGFHLYQFIQVMKVKCQF